MFIHDVRLQFVAFVWIGAWSCDPGRCFRIRFLGWTKRLSSDLWACLLDWRSQRIKFQLAAAPARSDRNTSLHTRIHTVSLTSPGLGLIIYWQRASGKALRLRRPGRQPSRITWLWKEAIGGFTFTCGGCWRGTRPRLYLLKLHRLGTLGRGRGSSYLARLKWGKRKGGPEACHFLPSFHSIKLCVHACSPRIPGDQRR